MKKYSSQDLIDINIGHYYRAGVGFIDDVVLVLSHENNTVVFEYVDSQNLPSVGVREMLPTYAFKVIFDYHHSYSAVQQFKSDLYDLLNK